MRRAKKNRPKRGRRPLDRQNLPFVSKPPIAQNEPQRLEALRRYDLLDSPLEKEFNHIARLASQICRTPIALISVIDEARQWTKAGVGFAMKTTPRRISFCAHAILKPDDVMIVPDARKDRRFATNPLVTGQPHVRFYAGAPLVTPDGFPLGTICAIDRKTRKLNRGQIAALRALSREVVARLELRRLARDSDRRVRQGTEELDETNEPSRASVAARERAEEVSGSQAVGLKKTKLELEKSNKMTDESLAIMAHELRTPVNIVAGYAGMLKDGLFGQINAEQKEVLIKIIDCAEELMNMIAGLKKSNPAALRK